MITISTMTIEEAIKHAEEAAEMNQAIADNTEHENWMNIAECEKCAAEHRQLAEWLKQLKAVKDFIRQHDEDSMPEDFWYIDKIRNEAQE